MATLDRMPAGLMQHRRWEDIASMILGVAIIISPMVYGNAGMPKMVATTAIVGAVVVVLAGLEQVFLRRWEEFLSLLCGAWMIISPFFFQYGGTLRSWHIGLGIAVAVLAVLELWQDRNRSLEA